MKQFATYALLSTAAAAAAVAATFALPLADAERSAALLGVALSAASGGLALVLKRRALAKAGLSAVLTAFVAIFALRGLLLALGLWVVVRAQGPELALVIAFFAVFFVQQTLELSWVVAASKDLKGARAT